jgi:acetyltransferase
MPDLKAFLSPNAVAVIGAANNPDILRGRIMKMMMGHDFEAKVYPISRNNGQGFGLKAYRKISNVPEHLDLAILISPTEFVSDTLRECGRSGVKAAHIITSGFA